MTDYYIPAVFLVLWFVILFANVVIARFQFGSLKAMIFGPKGRKELGEILVKKTWVGSKKVLVFAVEDSSSEKAVGLEVVVKTFLSRHRLPLILSSSDALKLAALLESTVARERKGSLRI